MPEITLSRQFEEIARACEAVEAYVETHGWTPSDVVRVGLVIGEAIGNAVEHGAGDTVDVRYGIMQNLLTIQINDAGKGPDPSRLAGASLPSSPWATRGRGLYILSELADEVSSEAGGLLLTLRPRG